MRIGNEPRQRPADAGLQGNQLTAFSSFNFTATPSKPSCRPTPGDQIQLRLLQGHRKAARHECAWPPWYLNRDARTDPGRSTTRVTKSQAIGTSEHFEFDFNDKVAPVLNTLGIRRFLYQSALSMILERDVGVDANLSLFHADIMPSCTISVAAQALRRAMCGCQPKKQTHRVADCATPPTLSA